VTPSVRYLGFRAWLIYRYGEGHFADSWQAFTDFSAYAECALVLGNLAQERSLNGLIGADDALIRLDANYQPHQHLSSCEGAGDNPSIRGPPNNLAFHGPATIRCPDSPRNAGSPLPWLWTRRSRKSR
jgi:hypothetical protein